jgi:hypothetical protein
MDSVKEKAAIALPPAGIMKHRVPAETMATASGTITDARKEAVLPVSAPGSAAYLARTTSAANGTVSTSVVNVRSVMVTAGRNVIVTMEHASGISQTFGASAAQRQVVPDLQALRASRSVQIWAMKSAKPAQSACLPRYSFLKAADLSNNQRFLTDAETGESYLSISNSL